MATTKNYAFIPGAPNQNVFGRRPNPEDWSGRQPISRGNLNPNDSEIQLFAQLFLTFFCGEKMAIFLEFWEFSRAVPDFELQSGQKSLRGMAGI